MIRELDRVVLATPVKAHGLEAGDIGTVVLVHAGGKGYEVEFVALDGETITVTTLDSSNNKATAGNAGILPACVVRCRLEGGAPRVGCFLTTPLLAAQVRPIAHREIAHARMVAVH